MSPALPAEQSRSWWSLSSRSSKQDFHTDIDKPVSKNPGRNFPSFSSFIGRKSRKHPTLPIEEPPSPLQSPFTSHVHQTDLRGEPSLRSPLSPAESIEPLTPVDGFREGQRSLLTLDPFGVRGPVARGPTSPSTFSTRSNNSFLDVCSRPDKSILYFRPSYSSYSSNSNSVYESQSPDLIKGHNANAEEQIFSSSPMNNMKKSTSSTYSKPLLPVHQPPIRLRGMTQSDSHRPLTSQGAYATIRQRYLSSPGSRPLPSWGTTPPLPSWVPGSQLSSHPIKRPSSSGCTSPNQSVTAVPTTHMQTIARQTSIQRLQPPPTSPTHELPPWPSNATEEPRPESQVEDQSDSHCNGSFSSSISFVSSTPSNEGSVSDFDQTKEQDHDTENRSFVTNLQLESEMADIPSKRPPSVQTPMSTFLEASQILRKQKLYHQFEHGHMVSVAPSSQSPPLASLAQDSRYGSTLSHTSTLATVSVPPVQQRVFSGSDSRRPSTSPGADTRGIRRDHERPTIASPSKTLAANMLTLKSFWEDHPPSPTQSDHLSQPIISLDLLAQIEANLEDCSLPPLSIPSDCGQERTITTTTAPSDRDGEVDSSSISSQSLSEVSKTAQLAAKSITVPMTETENPLGTSMGRTVSLLKVRPSTTPPLSRRPAAASDTTSLGPLAPVPALHEPEVLKNIQPLLIDTLSPTLSGMTTSTLISPQAFRKSQHESFNASDVKLPPLQLRSLPPPPRPRAKAETVTAINKLPEEPRQKRGRVKNSIGVDFGPGQRHAITPNIHLNVSPSQPMAQAPTFGTRLILPRDPSWPLVQSCRQPEGVQRISSQVISNTIPPDERKLSRRISLHRKPSFLDLDQDNDTKAVGMLDLQSMKSPSFSYNISATESFLEFERESFDTIRNRP